MKSTAFAGIFLALLGCSPQQAERPARSGMLDSSSLATPAVASAPKTPAECTIPELDSTKAGGHPGNVRKLCVYQQESLTELIRAIEGTEREVRAIDLQEGTLTMDVWQTDSLNYFEQAPYLPYSWRYYYFHDIYHTFFAHEEIGRVVVLLNGENYTQLPASGDVDAMLLPPEGMRKSWYVLGLDYRDVLDAEDPTIYESDQPNTVRARLLDSVIQQRAVEQPTK